jgi:hypothetical protein
VVFRRQQRSTIRKSDAEEHGSALEERDFRQDWAFERLHPGARLRSYQVIEAPPGLVDGIP